MIFVAHAVARCLASHLAAAFVAVLALAPVALTAQNATETSTAQPAPPARTCWRGEPPPKCRVFWITEFGYDAIVASSTTRRSYGEGPWAYSETVRDVTPRVIWTIGPMVNGSGLRATGGTLSLGPTGDGWRAAIEARRRWWHPVGSGIDVSAGLVRTQARFGGGQHGDTRYGLTGGVLLVGGDFVEITSRSDVLFGHGHPRYGTSVGFGLGSHAAVGGTLIAGVTFLLMLLAYDGT